MIMILFCLRLRAGFRLLELLAIVGGVDYNPAAIDACFCGADETHAVEIDDT